MGSIPEFGSGLNFPPRTLGSGVQGGLVKFEMSPSSSRWQEDECFYQGQESEWEETPSLGREGEIFYGGVVSGNERDGLCLGR